MPKAIRSTPKAGQLVISVSQRTTRKSPYSDRHGKLHSVLAVSWRKILEPYRQCAGAVQPGEGTIVSRRGIGDRAIWTKPLAACGGRGQAMGFAWIFADSWG